MKRVIIHAIVMIVHSQGIVRRGEQECPLTPAALIRQPAEIRPRVLILRLIESGSRRVAVDTNPLDEFMQRRIAEAETGRLLWMAWTR